MEYKPNEFLNSIVEVFTAENDRQVNARLKAGWKILLTYTTSYDPSMKHLTPRILLGRSNDVPEWTEDQNTLD